MQMSTGVVYRSFTHPCVLETIFSSHCSSQRLAALTGEVGCEQSKEKEPPPPAAMETLQETFSMPEEDFSPFYGR